MNVIAGWSVFGLTLGAGLALCGQQTEFYPVALLVSGILAVVVAAVIPHRVTPIRREK